jgi:hypothetical protein
VATTRGREEGTVPFIIQFSKSQHAALKERAAKDLRSMSDVIRLALEHYKVGGR